MPEAASLVFLQLEERIHVRVPGQARTVCDLVPPLLGSNRIEDFDLDWCPTCQEAYRNRPLVSAC